VHSRARYARTTGWCVIINNHTNHFADTSFITELIIDGWINYNVDGVRLQLDGDFEPMRPRTFRGRFGKLSVVG